MPGDVYADILTSHGFRQIGTFHDRLNVSVWWQAEAKVQVLLVRVGSSSLLKGTKSYYLKSISEEGETQARDIGPLQDYLEAHFPEMRLSFSFFRDVTPTLAAAHIRKKARTQTPTISFPTVDDVSKLQRSLTQHHADERSISTLLELDEQDTDLLRSYTSRKRDETRRKSEQIQQQLEERKEKLSLFRHLQNEYQRKGSAASLSFSISSNVQLVDSPDRFGDALSSIVKELTDYHRYQVSQKLSGGRLNIHVAEAEEPVHVWIEEWLLGGLAPRELERLGTQFELLREAGAKRLMVTPNEDIQFDGHTKDDRKRLAARVVSTLVRRLDRTGDQRLRRREITESDMPLCPGLLMNGDVVTPDRFVMVLNELNHCYLSGATGSGKSYLGRVLIEEAAARKDLNILVLDPRNQAAGLLVPEDRESILALYPDFRLQRDHARGFGFTYRAPGQNIGTPLPPRLDQLGVGRHIVSFRGLDDKRRCELFADILDGVFDKHADSESTTPRLLIVIEEAHRFTKKRVADDAKSAGARAENALDRTVREGRKFGCCVIILSQTIRDFAYDSASIRQNTNTKIFMHNSDREVEYASDFIGDGRQIIHLPPATAFIYNAAWGSAKIKVRPPYSKVWEFGAQETRRLVSDPDADVNEVSARARSLYSTIQRLQLERQAAVNVTDLCQAARITSKRQIQSLLTELESVGLVRSKRLRDRGRPRVIETIVASNSADGITDQTGTEGGPNG